MPSLSHIFEKVHIHMACCGGTMTIREHAADTTDGGEEKRLGKWHAFKTLLRSWFGGRIWGGRQTGARGPEVRHCAGEDAPLVEVAVDLHLATGRWCVGSGRAEFLSRILTTSGRRTWSTCNFVGVRMMGIGTWSRSLTCCPSTLGSCP